MGYEVQIDAYAGPFDLLLHLILREEVDLWDISLAEIVDAYLNELDSIRFESGETLDLEVATEFLLIAATLVELKTRRLLPGPSDLELDEELLRFEERDLLLARLLECKTFKDAANAVATMMRFADRSLPRVAGPEEPFRSLVPDPLEQLKLSALRNAARRMLTPKPNPIVQTDHIAPIRASVADAIVTILDRIPTTESVSFHDLAADADSRLEVIVRFLAVLELFKQGVLDLDQASNFATLSVRRLVEPRTLDARSIADWDDDGPSEPASARGEQA